MKNNFLNWLELKQKINKYKRIKFHEREIYMCYLGLNIGSEHNLILSQIRLIDSKRFKYKKGIVDKNNFNEIKNKIIKII
jgi:hypothetical protein